MPTGTCRYPQHHSGPSAGPPIGLILALIAGAIVVAEWRTVIVVLAVIAAVAIVTAGVVLLVHSAHTAPYDSAWTTEEPGQLPATTWTAQVSHPGTAALAAENAALRRELAERHAIEAPQQHLHLHGLTPDDINAIIQHRAIPRD